MFVVGFFLKIEHQSETALYFKSNLRAKQSSRLQETSGKGKKIEPNSLVWCSVSQMLNKIETSSSE